MKTKLVVTILFITTLLSVSSCGSNIEDIHTNPQKVPINISINNDENYLMDENATIAIPFTVYPVDIDISNLKIEYMDYIYSTTDILAFRDLSIDEIIPTEKAGSYIAHLYITDETEHDHFIPKENKRYRIVFSRAYFYLDTYKSNNFNVVFTKGIEQQL